MPIEIFCCYAHEDRQFLHELQIHLRMLQRQGLIGIWHDRDISAGTEWEQEISKHLNEAHIILLLISPAFMASDFCYGIEMKRALERHERGEARVIPVILRPVYWQKAPFSKLQPLPTNEKPITKWQNRDDAFFDVAEGIRKAIDEFASMLSIPENVQEQEPTKEKLLTLGTNARVSLSIAHELAHRGYQSTYAVLMWLKRKYSRSRIVEGREELDFIKIDTHGTQTGFIVKFCEFPVVGEEISNLYSALDTIYDGQKLNKLMIVIVFPDSPLANSELARLEKKLIPLPEGISIVTSLVYANNNLHIVGTIPKYLFSG